MPPPLLLLATPLAATPQHEPASAFTAHLHDGRPEAQLDLAQSELEAFEATVLASRRQLGRAQALPPSSEKLQALWSFIQGTSGALSDLGLERRIIASGSHRLHYPPIVAETIASVIEQVLEVAYVTLEAALLDMALGWCLRLFRHAPAASPARQLALLHGSRVYAGVKNDPSSTEWCDAMQLLDAYALHDHSDDGGGGDDDGGGGGSRAAGARAGVGAGGGRGLRPSARQLQRALDAMPSTLSRVQYAVASSKCASLLLAGTVPPPPSFLDEPSRGRAAAAQAAAQAAADAATDGTPAHGATDGAALAAAHAAARQALALMEHNLARGHVPLSGGGGHGEGGGGGPARGGAGCVQCWHAMREAYYVLGQARRPQPPPPPCRGRLHRGPRLGSSPPPSRPPPPPPPSRSPGRMRAPTPAALLRLQQQLH